MNYVDVLKSKKKKKQNKTKQNALCSRFLCGVLTCCCFVGAGRGCGGESVQAWAVIVGIRIGTGIGFGFVVVGVGFVCARDNFWLAKAALGWLGGRFDALAQRGDSVGHKLDGRDGRAPAPQASSAD